MFDFLFDITLGQSWFTFRCLWPSGRIRAPTNQASAAEIEPIAVSTYFRNFGSYFSVESEWFCCVNICGIRLYVILVMFSNKQGVPTYVDYLLGAYSLAISLHSIRGTLGMRIKLSRLLGDWLNVHIYTGVQSNTLIRKYSDIRKNVLISEFSLYASFLFFQQNTYLSYTQWQKKCATTTPSLMTAWRIFSSAQTSRQGQPIIQWRHEL